MERATWEDVKRAKEALLIVNCTRTKIWQICPNAPRLLPAMVAYQGSSFHRFLFLLRTYKITHPWVILSGKYGFIEPCTLISDYNVCLGTSEAISLDELRQQVMEKSVAGRPLASFSQVYVFTKDPEYIRAVEYAFDGVAKCYHLDAH